MSYPYVPILPNGATWYSLAVVLHRMTGERSKSRTYNSLYGVRGPGCPRPEDLAPEPFHSTLAIESRLEFRPIRSVSEIYLGIVNPADWARLKHESKSLSWCPDCVDEDIESQGWPAWRVMHQVHFLHDCPIHGKRLYVRCLSCGENKDDGTKWMLPSNTCENCGSTEFGGHEVRPSDGYTALLQNIRSFSDAKTAPFNSILWNDNRRALLMRMWSQPAVEGRLRQLLESRWGGSSIERIPAKLSSLEDCSWFEKAFDCQEPASPLVRLLIYDVLVSAGLWGK